MSELDELLADLTLEQRAKLRQALQLLEVRCSCVASKDAIWWRPSQVGWRLEAVASRNKKLLAAKSAFKDPIGKMHFGMDVPVPPRVYTRHVRQPPS